MRVLGKQIKENQPKKKDEDELLLQIMKQNEYYVIEQLKRKPAIILLLSLILRSDVHHQALQRVINQAFVTCNITQGQFEKIIGQIQALNFIMFSDDEIDPASLKHTKTLHVIVKCKGYMIAKVLIDNGSALNVLLSATLARLPIELSLMRLVRAFDETKRDVLGDIELPLHIGVCIFHVTFQVMNIEPAYTMLLGRP